ncbi:MAG: FliM/FliN family flagellar motor switch protein [Sedimentisphaerales bacterium]|nr:FliM/FliN family flagellar motor switch protein [Sedimentisphaerales bacterium]
MAETAEVVKEEELADASSTDSKTTAQSIELPEAGDGNVENPTGSIDILLDMDVPVTVSIGQAQIPIRQLLQLGPGSVLKLEKNIDQPADLYLKGTKFATGNIVVVENHFAVRIKQVIGT